MFKIDKLIVTLCACYLGILPLGFPHLMFIIGTIYLLQKCSSNKVSLNILWIFLFIAFGLFQVTLVGGDWKAMINNVTSMMMFPIACEVLRNKSKERLIEIGISFVKVTICLFIVEAIVRYGLSIAIPKGVGLYRFKFHSFMFQDTNFAGLVLLVVIFFAKYLKLFAGVYTLQKYYAIAVILLLMTVSRAAILAYVISELFFYKIEVFKYLRQFGFRFIQYAIVGSFIGTTIFLWLSEDPSFRSKLYIFELAENIFSSDLGYVKYIGVGYDKSEELLGIYAHNVIFLYFIDTGICGIILKMLFLLYIMIQSRWQALIIFFPFFIAAQSAVGYGVHYLYVIFAIVVLLSKKNIYSNEKNNHCYN